MLGKILSVLPIIVSFLSKKIPNGRTLVKITKEDDPISVENTFKEYLISDEFIGQLRSQVFPFTPIKNIKDNWPLVVEALDIRDLLFKDMVIYTLATILVENDKFKPVKEVASKYSTLNGKPPYNFSKYDVHPNLGNTKPGDGAHFRGAGLIQITGRANYTHMDKVLGLEGGLIEHGADAANQAKIAAAILAQYFKDREERILKALDLRDFPNLRRIVNGGTMHLDKFKDAFLKVEKLL